MQRWELLLTIHKIRNKIDEFEKKHPGKTYANYTHLELINLIQDIQTSCQKVNE